MSTNSITARHQSFADISKPSHMWRWLEHDLRELIFSDHSHNLGSSIIIGNATKLEQVLHLTWYTGAGSYCRLSVWLGGGSDWESVYYCWFEGHAYPCLFCFTVFKREASVSAQTTLQFCFSSVFFIANWSLMNIFYVNWKALFLFWTLSCVLRIHKMHITGKSTN